MTASDGFQQHFERLRAAILAEWPKLDPDALDATGGDLDAVVELISAISGHTRAFVTAQLDELQRLGDSGWVRGLEGALGRLEARAKELRAQVPDELAEAATRRVRERPLESLLMALGLGVILGLILGRR